MKLCCAAHDDVTRLNRWDDIDVREKRGAPSKREKVVSCSKRWKKKHDKFAMRWTSDTVSLPQPLYLNQELRRRKKWISSPPESLLPVDVSNRDDDEIWCWMGRDEEEKNISKIMLWMRRAEMKSSCLAAISRWCLMMHIYGGDWNVLHIHRDITEQQDRIFSR